MASLQSPSAHIIFIIIIVFIIIIIRAGDTNVLAASRLKPLQQQLWWAGSNLIDPHPLDPDPGPHPPSSLHCNAIEAKARRRSALMEQ